MTTRSENLVWIDLEMTGLDPDRDRTIEIATTVTNAQLEVFAEGPVTAIHQPDVVMHAMDDWNRTTHGGSSLLERVQSSAVTAEQAKELTEPGASPMRGDSISQDRRFLYREMPRLERYFHYRNLDGSTLKELARRWAPDVLAGMSKEPRHLALYDVRESIRELGYYWRTMINGSSPALWKLKLPVTTT